MEELDVDAIGVGGALYGVASDGPPDDLGGEPDIFDRGPKVSAVHPRPDGSPGGGGFREGFKVHSCGVFQRNNRGNREIRVRTRQTEGGRGGKPRVREFSYYDWLTSLKKAGEEDAGVNC